MTYSEVECRIPWRGRPVTPLLEADSGPSSGKAPVVSGGLLRPVDASEGFRTSGFLKDGGVRRPFWERKRIRPFCCRPTGLHQARCLPLSVSLSLPPSLSPSLPVSLSLALSLSLSLSVGLCLSLSLSLSLSLCSLDRLLNHSRRAARQKRIHGTHPNGSALSNVAGRRLLALSLEAGGRKTGLAAEPRVEWECHYGANVI